MDERGGRNAETIVDDGDPVGDQLVAPGPGEPSEPIEEEFLDGYQPV